MPKTPRLKRPASWYRSMIQGSLVNDFLVVIADEHCDAQRRTTRTSRLTACAQTELRAFHRCLKMYYKCSQIANPPSTPFLSTVFSALVLSALGSPLPLAWFSQRTIPIINLDECLQDVRLYPLRLPHLRTLVALNVTALRFPVRPPELSEPSDLPNPYCSSVYLSTV